MYGLLITIHIIACLTLIMVILLQAGRGGGLSEAFGGRGLEQAFGTRTATFLTRMTAGAAVVFILTCLSLAVISSRRGRSLIELEKMKKKITEEVEVGVSEEEPVPITKEKF